MSRFAVSLSLVLAGLAAGCNRRVPEPPPVPGDVISFSVADRTLKVKVVFDDISRSKGLMHVKSLPRDSGMLFIFRLPARQSFWMKDTLIPLSIAFLDDDGKILEIHDMKPKDTSSTRSKYKVRHALEVNQGWFREVGLGVGSQLSDFRKKVQRFRAR